MDGVPWNCCPLWSLKVKLLALLMVRALLKRQFQFIIVDLKSTKPNTVSVISAAIVAKKVVKNDFMYRGIILLGTNLGDKYVRFGIGPEGTPRAP